MCMDGGHTYAYLQVQDNKMQIYVLHKSDKNMNIQDNNLRTINSRQGKFTAQSQWTLSHSQQTSFLEEIRELPIYSKILKPINSKTLKKICWKKHSRSRICKTTIPIFLTPLIWKPKKKKAHQLQIEWIQLKINSHSKNKMDQPKIKHTASTHRDLEPRRRAPTTQPLANRRRNQQQQHR